MVSASNLWAMLFGDGHGGRRPKDVCMAMALGGSSSYPPVVTSTFNVEGEIFVLVMLNRGQWRTPYPYYIDFVAVLEGSAIEIADDDDGYIDLITVDQPSLRPRGYPRDANFTCRSNQSTFVVRLKR